VNGTGHKERPPDDVRSRRIGWRAASRLLDGQDGGHGTEDLRTLITLASVPMDDVTARSEPAEHAAASRDVTRVRHALDDAAAPGTSPLPDALLAAFHASAAVTPTTVKTATVRRQSTTRAVVLRSGAAVLVVCGAGTAAASIGVLPAGVQHIAHEYLGVGSAPAPSTHVPSSSAAPSQSSAGSNSAAPTSPTPGAASASALIALCRRVPQAGNDWTAGLSAADQATLIAAAGNEHKVKGYCKQLLDTVSDSTTAKAKPSSSGSATPSSESVTPSPEPTGKPSTAPDIKVTEPRGNAHASHAPAPQSSSSGSSSH
jgi:hypothetical protein